MGVCILEMYRYILKHKFRVQYYNMRTDGRCEIHLTRPNDRSDDSRWGDRYLVLFPVMSWW